MSEPNKEKALALRTLIDTLFTYDENMCIYKVNAREVTASYIEDVIDFIAENGRRPNLSEL